MKRFAALYDAMDASTGTGDKVEAMRAYFAQAPAADAAWAVFFLTGQRLKRALPTAALRAAADEVIGLPGWLVDECYGSVGDLSETLALLIPEPASSSVEPLHRVVEERILPLASAGDERRRTMLHDAWRVFGGVERLLFHKLLRGEFRVGVQRRLVVRGLAEAFGLEAALIERRLIGGLRPTPDAFAALVSTDSGESDPSRPYPFFLANPLQADPATLGDIASWRLEWKYDGIRAQVIQRGGKVTIWSRGEEVITHQFPEVADAARRLPDGTALDGEIVAWRDGAGPAGGHPLPFAELQKRLNRKVPPTHEPGLFDTDRAAYIAFDVLEVDGIDIRERPLAERLKLLPGLVERLGDAARVSPAIQAASWAEAAAQRLESRRRHAEGLMLKHLGSTYGSGRIRQDAEGGTPAGWWKWKVDPYSVDAVLVYAQPGSGRRAGLFTDYTFALWEGQGQARTLLPFAKAYSGLSNEEIARVDAFVRRSTIGRSGPVRQVEPTQVFEIAFEAIAESARHKAGLAVRFPRIVRWRTDKKPEEADTMDTLRAMLRDS